MAKRSQPRKPWSLADTQCIAANTLRGHPGRPHSDPHWRGERRELCRNGRSDARPFSRAWRRLGWRLNLAPKLRLTSFNLVPKLRLTSFNLVPKLRLTSFNLVPKLRLGTDRLGSPASPLGEAELTSFPSSAWERTVWEAPLPHWARQSFTEVNLVPKLRLGTDRLGSSASPLGEAELHGSAFPSRAWEREQDFHHPPRDKLGRPSSRTVRPKG
jgi:hypothetical protein